MLSREGGNNQRLAQMLGIFSKDKKHPIAVNIPSGDRSSYSMERYKFLLDAPFLISNKCCNVMKKSPCHAYERKTKRFPMTGQMASESKVRTQKWLQNGCNAFDAKHKVSNPMAFWTEQDVLLYIRLYNIKICSIYGRIVTDDELAGQMTMFSDDKQLFELMNPTLRTTGCKRTGCMFCGFGCHLDKPGEGRFEMMKYTHPNQYDYIMRTKDQGGLDYKNVIDWLNEHGNLHIRY